MTRYKLITPVVTAVQNTGDLDTLSHEHPWIANQELSGNIRRSLNSSDVLQIKTSEGFRRCDTGNWILIDGMGIMSVVNDEFFRGGYEEVEDVE